MLGQLSRLGVDVVGITGIQVATCAQQGYVLYDG
jgi:hypothetical protein